MRFVKPAEQITVDWWEELSREAGHAYAATSEAYRLFDQPTGPSLLISACDDFSIRYQAKHHPNDDIVKHTTQFDGSGLDNSRYMNLEIPCPVVRERCRPKDKFVAKVDRYTAFTFDRLPAWLTRWYVTNLDVAEPGFDFLPFGLNNDGHGSSILPNYVGREKRGLLYVNFRINTMEREMLVAHYRQCPWATVRTENVPVEQYLAEVAEHKYCLSPFGNGLDCYRVYESLYLGSVPLLTDSIFARHLLAARLPIGVVSSLFRLNPADLEGRWADFQTGNYDLSFVTKSFWRHHFGLR